MRQLVIIGVLLLNLSAFEPKAQAQETTVTVTMAAPIFLTPNEQLTPLRVAKEGSVIRLIKQEGDWCNIEFQDPEVGRRSGYIRTRFVRMPNRDLTPQDLSITEGPSSPTKPPERATRPQSNEQAVVFKNAQLRQQQGDKTKDAYVSLRFDATRLVLDGLTPNGRSQPGLRTIDYREVKTAEYTFGKSPRVAAAILVSPFFLASSSKSHWLTIKSESDYALLRLDKSNYKLVIAELEKRTGIKVADVGENK